MTAVDVRDDSFETEVLGSGKPVLLYVWAPWCGPCRMVGPAAQRLAEKQPERFKLAAANLEEFEAQSEQLQVRATPTLILFAAGREIARRSGALMESQLAQWLDANLP